MNIISKIIIGWPMVHFKKRRFSESSRGTEGNPIYETNRQTNRKFNVEFSGKTVKRIGD